MDNKNINATNQLQDKNENENGNIKPAGKPALIMGMFCFVLLLAVMAAAVNLNEGPRSKSDTGDIELNEWQLKSDGGSYTGVSMPIPFNDNDVLVLKTHLPQMSENKTLYIDAHFRTINVFVEDESEKYLIKIHEAKPAVLGWIKTTAGNFIELVPLSSEFSGRGIVIEIEKRGNNRSSVINGISLTNRSSVVMRRLMDNFLVIIISLFACFFSVLFFLVWLYIKARGISVAASNYDAGMLLSTSIFSAVVGIWIISNFHIIGTATDRLAASGTINYVVFNIAPLGCSAVIRSLAGKKFFIINLVHWLTIWSFTIQILSFMLGLSDLVDTVVFTHILSIMTLVEMFAVNAKFMVDRDKAVKPYMVVGLAIAFVLCIVSMIFFYRGMEWRPVIQFAILTLVAVFIIETISMLYGTIRDGIHMEEIKKYVYIDVLTKMQNRRSYNEELERVKELDEEEKAGLIIVNFDVNGLKEVNDTKGHDAGDELIAGAGQCIESVFDRFGNCYRIGGDEFSAVIFASIEQLYDLIAEFDRKVLSWSGSMVKELSVSYGYGLYSEYPGRTPEALADIADKSMYDMKSRYYQSKGRDRRHR